MSLATNAAMNLFSMVMLAILWYHFSRYNDSESFQGRLFLSILIATLFLLAFDILGRFDGHPDTIFPIVNRAGNILVFSTNSVVPCLWFLYVHYQVYHSKRKLKRLSALLFILWGFNAVLLTVSQFTGWLYSIDSNNIYQRGPLFFLSAIIPIGLVAFVFLFIILNREKIERRYFPSLVFFAIPPFLVSIASIWVYGISMMPNSIAFSLLVVYLNIQTSSVFTDHLTGVYTRKALDVFLREKIDGSSEHKTFSAILIDIDNFKKINDTYGHDTGDEALRAAASIMKGCLRESDLIARYGGDEFCIILNISDEDALDAAVLRLNAAVSHYSETANKPYVLSFSIGKAVYDPTAYPTPEEFLKRIDILMYRNKQGKKG